MSKNINQTDYRKTVGDWLSMSFEWRIPVYQRHYAWNSKEEFGPTQLFWEVVEEQTRKRLKNEPPPPHYFGAILVENKSRDLDEIQKYDVVDGQQRLTTLNISMFALIGVAAKFGYKKEVKDQLANYIFADPSREKRSKPRLLPTNFDKGQYEKLLSHAYRESRLPTPGENEYYDKSKIVEACNFFSEVFFNFVNHTNEEDPMQSINALQETLLNGFELILIPLAKTDEAQKVFESLNNTAKPLTTFDLIRNDVFYRAEKEEQKLDEKLFNSEQWQQFENPFWEESPRRSDKNTHVELYIARMLIAEQKRSILLNRNSIFKEYKDYARSGKIIGVESEIDLISKYVNIYKYLINPTAKNPVSKDFDFGFFNYATCKSMDFYPVVFVIAKCDIPVEEKQRMLDQLESYIMRRCICGLPEGDYNKQAPSICKELGNKPSYSKLDDFLKNSDGETRVFPTDDRIFSSCSGSDFYSNKRKKYVFERIVWHTTEDRDEKRDIKKLSVDHIIPQSWKEVEGWKNALLDQFDEVTIDARIHTIGNLTPMSPGLNSSKSNYAWKRDDGTQEKRGAQAWLKKCDLKMTRELADNDSWDINNINNRSKKLAKYICEIWPYDLPNS